MVGATAVLTIAVLWPLIKRWLKRMRRLIRQEHQIALVGAQRMHPRIGCNYDSAVEISRTQILVFDIYPNEKSTNRL
jgi:hypothetical protein